MKKAYILLPFLLFLTIFPLFSQNFLTGYDLSNQVYNTLYDKSLTFRTQNLVITGENQFPYNITVTPSRNRGTDFSARQFLIVINQEQVLDNQKIVKDIMNFIRTTSFAFNTSILFSYGDFQNVPKRGMIHGTQSYLQDFSPGENTTVLILDLDSNANKIVTSTNGLTCPSYLIHNAYNLYLQNNIAENLSTYFVSQQTKYKFFHDNQLSYFFNEEIPAIKLCFKKENSTPEMAGTIVRNFINSYAKEFNTVWDQHFIILKLGSSYIKIDETGIVKYIIFLLFAVVLFISLLAFINKNIKNQAWKKIVKIWYSLPNTYFIIVIAFFFGKLIFLIFTNHLSIQAKITTLFFLQVFFSLLFTSTYYVFQIRLTNDKLNEKSIDFLILFSSLLNQIVFTFIDISLFPLFLGFLLLSVLILIFKKRIFHIIILFLMVFLFIPYLNTLLYKTDIQGFSFFFTKNKGIFFIEALILTPIILTYLRILASYRTKLTNYKRLIITESSIFCALSILLIIFAIASTSRMKTHSVYASQKPLKIEKQNYCLSYIEYEDTNVFEDKIRTIKIQLPDFTEQCDLRIKTTGASPILYSDNEYELSSPTEAYFLIPSRPSKNLSFTYGLEAEESTIELSVIYSDKDNNLKSESISLIAGVSNGS